MAISTPRCLDIQLPGGGKINNCAQGVPSENIPSIPDPASEDESTSAPEAADGDFGVGLPAPPVEDEPTPSLSADGDSDSGRDAPPEIEGPGGLDDLFTLMGGNLTGGNLTGGNLTGGNLTGGNLTESGEEEPTAMGGNLTGGNLTESGEEEQTEGEEDSGEDEGLEEPADISTLDLIGKWDMTGRSNGYPVSSEIAFFDDGSYLISGKISNLPNGNSPFYYVGNYTLDTASQELLLRTNTGIETSYKLSNLNSDSFTASNDQTSEHYTIRRV